ncbi:MAG: ATP-dependent DNA helicase RecG [Treponemataceae bacterium]|nr:ATP-dependent DNA helicase RecG [Treponemataceae bacterium]
MKLKDIETPISTISGIGPSLQSAFSKLNIFNISDLLSTYPRDYEDRTQTIPIKDFAKVSKVHCFAKVLDHQWFGFGKMKTLKIIIFDGETRGTLVCYNRPFMEKSLSIGSIISVTAPFSYKYGEIQTSIFDAQIISKSGELQDFVGKLDPTSKILSLYRLTSGLSQNQYRKTISQALKMYGNGISNELPENVIQRQDLLSKQKAIHVIHCPENLDELDKAIKTIKFEELFFFQSAILNRVAERKKISKASTDFTDLSPRQIKLASSLPFELTDDQKKIIATINAEIDSSCKDAIKFHENQDEFSENAKPFTLSRLIQGDVGSGKTLVAFFAALRIIDWGGQCVILSPTELLARQHAENASKLLSPLGINPSFLTGNIKAKGRNQLLNSIKNGETQLIIGTHALFSKNVQYKNLQLAIVDEQHRFGVIQRNFIKEKCAIPNILMMSATPIPQTLALTVFGDLDISTIKTMPKGRLPIKTHLTKPGNESHVYESVRKELQNGNQAYFVYPMIENLSDDEENPNYSNPSKKIKNAVEMFEHLSKNVYPEFKCGLIHSKVDEDEQNQILQDFKDGKINIIVATTVVEVGVDVPNATCMVIEQAERFGLAALHQLRGRVGRGAKQSYCFLIYGANLTEIGKQRLKAMYENTDGFELAELDLKLRGPGEVAGIQQSGYLSLGLSDPVQDKELLEIARSEVLATLN